MRPVIDASRHDAERHVRRVERVMAERREYQPRRRSPMHKGHGAERGLARWTTSNGEHTAAQRHAPRHRELHEEVVRMLPIDQRLAVERLADLEDLTIATFADGRRIQAEHGIQTKWLMSMRVRRHAHTPVGCHELVAPARASLVVEQAVHDAVLHELPA